MMLIPETLRMTIFGRKQPGAAQNMKIERSTRVFADTVRDSLDEPLGPLLPLLEKLLPQQDANLEGLATPPRLPSPSRRRDCESTRRTRQSAPPTGVSQVTCNPLCDRRVKRR